MTRSRTFLASSTEDWEAARAQYEEIIRGCALLDANGDIDTHVVGRSPEWLGVYEELGAVYLELWRRGIQSDLRAASEVLSRIQALPAGIGEPWWRGRSVAVRRLGGRTSAH